LLATTTVRTSGRFASMSRNARASTEDDEIAEIARSSGAEVPFLRPCRLADDHTPTREVFAPAIDQLNADGRLDAVCCIYATAPFLCASGLRAGLRRLEQGDCTHVFAVTRYAFPIQRVTSGRRAGEHVLRPFPGARKVGRMELCRDERAQMSSHFVFRVDAAVEIGTGHVMRCLTLADALHREGNRCKFICRDQGGNLVKLIVERGHEVALLSRAQYKVPVDGELAHFGWLRASHDEDACDSLDYLTDLPFILYVASTGKPMIISTGMADAGEIGEALEAARSGGCKELALLHCVSGYPAPPEDYNLRTIPDMMERFGVTVGLSDHTIDNVTAVAAVALGATLIEKHFTLDRSGGGPDDSFSLEPSEFRELCAFARVAWSALGTIDYGRKSSEAGNTLFRRSLYFVKNLPAGATITGDAIRSVRPGFGLPPKLLDKVLGKTLAREALENTPVTMAHLK
jgi:hypothetical protein